MGDLVNHPAFPRALFIGVFGGAGLALTALYSRRGPMIFPVYAAILAALALLLARYPDLRYVERWTALGHCPRGRRSRGGRLPLRVLRRLAQWRDDYPAAV
jgi:hypothetical protein